MLAIIEVSVQMVIFSVHGEKNREEMSLKVPKMAYRIKKAP